MDTLRLARHIALACLGAFALSTASPHPAASQFDAISYEMYLTAQHYIAEVDAAIKNCDRTRYDRAVRAINGLVGQAEKDLARAEQNLKNQKPPYAEKFDEALLRRRIAQNSLDSMKGVLARIPPYKCDPGRIGMNVPDGFKLEGTAFAGGVSSTSFGSHYSTSLVGARGAAAVSLPGQLQLQLGAEGVQTGKYDSVAKDRSYFAGGAHLNWNISANFDVGGFGGYQRSSPTFSEPTSTNNFFGAEGRFFFDGAMVGAQAGRIDVSSGPGTLTDATFVELRGKIALSRFSDIPPSGTILAGGLGRAWGKLSDTHLNADSTYWKVTLGFPLHQTGLTAFIAYTGFRNHVEDRGTVWREHIVKGGIQLNLGVPDSPQKAIEPLQRDPMVLGVTQAF